MVYKDWEISKKWNKDARSIEYFSKFKVKKISNDQIPHPALKT